MLKSWGGVLALFVIAFVCWYVGVLVAPSFFFVIFEIAAVIASVLCLCFFVIAVVRQFRPDASSYRIFAWTDGLLGITVTAYAVFGIMIDTGGLLSGFLGLILLIYVVPMIILLLAADFILYKRNKKRSEAG